MNKYKMATVLVLFFMIVISGVFMVNIRYTKNNGRTIDKSIFAAVDSKENGPELSNSALYSEITISNKENNKLAIYFNSKPFDLRLSMGNHIVYVNGEIFNNIGESLNQLVAR